MLEGLCGEDCIAELCRRDGIASSMDDGWCKAFPEAGMKRLSVNTIGAATVDEVKTLRRKAGALKEVVADLVLHSRLLEKSMPAAAGDEAWGTRPPRSWRSSSRSSHPTCRRAPPPDRHSTAYLRYDASSRGGPEALADSPWRPSRVWNRAPFDESQSKENAKHVLRAMKESAKQGFHYGAPVPLGYTVVEVEKRGVRIKKRLAVDTVEAEMASADVQS